MRGEPRIALKRLPHGDGLPLPAYQSGGAAGLDLLAAPPIDAAMSLEPGRRLLVPTGFAIEIPEGFEAQVRPRSGLAHHHGITVLNAPGTIDSDYRGEILVLLINFGDQAFEIRRGARIAQLVIAQFARAALVEVMELTETSRGGAGFGSTGIKASAQRRL
jgi:dUTP pyrophosphatase